jgi:acetyl esterase/lipase
MSGRPAIPEDLLRLMAEMGPRWGKDDLPSVSVRRMTEEFSKLHAAYPDDDVEVRHDIAYGDHERQKLDIFLPKTAGTGRPLVIFVHGGAFVEGHRNRTEQIYSNVTRFFARAGIPAINMGYRMAPETTYPGASLDIGTVVAWAHENAMGLGSDPGKIFLMGHSAGGAHAGSYALDKRLHPASGHGLRGLVIVSGRMRAEASDENPNARKVEAYYGADSAAMEDASPVNHVAADSLPTFIAIAQFENPLIDLHCMELAHRLAQAKRRAPPLIWLRGHNHTSGIAHLGTAEETLGRAILDFIADPS